MFHGFQQHPFASYDSTADLGGGGYGMGMGMGMGGAQPMHLPAYNLYQHNMKLGEHGHTGYGSQESLGYSYGAPKKKKWKKGHGTALSALTLLAFLFFLNLLQSCLKEHVNAMNPTVMVMTAGSREGNNALERVDFNEEMENRSNNGSFIEKRKIKFNENVTNIKSSAVDGTGNVKKMARIERVEINRDIG